MEDQNFQEIPERFYSFETGAPFQNCIECNDYLLDGKEYVIEKAMKRYPGYTAEDIVFDYAMCIECAQKMRDEFSRESLENIDNHLASHAHKLHRHLVSSKEDLDVDECLDTCMIKDVNVLQTNEYQIYAHCKGDKLFKRVPPYMICGAAVDELLPLISNATQDFLNGFYDKHFAPDPSLMEPDPTNKLVFI